MQKRIFSPIILTILLVGVILSACQTQKFDVSLRPGTYTAALPGGEFSFFVALNGTEIPYFKVKAACKEQTFDQIIAGIKASFTIDEKGEFGIKTADGYTFTGKFSVDGATASGTYDLKGYCTGDWQATQTLKAPATVATVNGTAISSEQYIQRTRYKRYVLVSQYARLKDLLVVLNQQNDPNTTATVQQQMEDIKVFLGNRQEVGQQALDDLIQEEIIRQEAARRGLTVDPAEIQNQINYSFQYYPEGYPTPQPGMTPQPTEPSIQKDIYDKKYQTMLTEVEANTGLKEADIRATFETQILTNKLAKALFPDLVNGEEQVHARHILVADQETAQKIMRLLSDGESWELLVSTYTIDTSTRETSGDLGWFGRGQMIAAFEEAAFTTPIGQVSSPVQSEFGWHIIKVEGKETRPINPEWMITLRNDQMAQWLTEQRASGVEISPDWQQLTPFMPAIPAQ